MRSFWFLLWATSLSAGPGLSDFLLPGLEEPSAASPSSPPLPPPPSLAASQTSSSGPGGPSQPPSSASAAPASAAGVPATQEKPIKRYHVWTVEFPRVETPFMIGLWIFFSSVAKIGFHMTPKLNQIFPESCLLIFVGVLIGVFLILTSTVHVSPLTPDTFFLYLMPPIILDAGYFMPNRLFFDHLGTILMFAVIGTIFNTFTIGVCLWGCGLTGLYGTEAPLLDMMLFAALISAVDPVAVLAVFEEIHVNEILYIVVFGESLLNDAVTVVLYHMFEAYVEMGAANILYTDIMSGVFSFFVVGLGGTVIGVAWGFATGLLTRYTDQVRVIEPIFIFVMAYLAYLNAEIFHMSGIMAVTFCGITMKNYVEANISHKSHTTVKYAMKMLSSSSETIIFMFLGVATVSDTHDWNTWFVILTILFCSLFRAIGVILLTAVVNKFRLYKLNKVDKFVMSYGGLRGAVAFALVLLIDPKVVRLQPMFVTTTIAVIYFTVFFQGITIKPLVKILNVKRAERRKPTMNERIHEKIMDHAMTGIEDILGHHGNHHLRDRFKRFDNKFIRPYILRDHHGAEPKILETYSKLAMRDAIEYMRRNASTIGNISGTESMSAIFRNYTAGNLNGRGSPVPSANYSQLDSSTWNIDLQELEYNPSKKDLTDAKIHHLLAEELVQPHRRHRRLSYSRHAVNDRDLSTQVNYKLHMNIRRLVGPGRHHHKRSKRLKDGKQHVSFPGIQQNGSAKQFTHDYLEEVIQEAENEDEKKKKNGKDDWESGITFTAHPTPEEEAEDGVPGLLSTLASFPGLKRARFVKQYRPRSGDYQDVPTVAETSLPWRRDAVHVKMKKPIDRPPGTWWCWNPNEGANSDSPVKKLSRDSTGGSDDTRVTTPTALETCLPWKRTDEGEMSTGPLKQSEFPPWCSNKEYLAYNSPSATFLGSRRGSLMGLFRGTPPESPQASVLLIEEGTSLLGTEKKAQKPRRGSMLELAHHPEEEYLIVGNTGSTPSLSEQWSTSQRTTQRQSSLPINTSVESFTSSATSLESSPHT